MGITQTTLSRLLRLRIATMQKSFNYKKLGDLLLPRTKGKKMRALFVGAFFLAGLASNAIAQTAFGPVPIKNNVNGVPVTINAKSWIITKSVHNKLLVNARIIADLIGFQRKFDKVLASFAPSADACANRRDDQSVVVVLKSGSLWPRNNQLIISTDGYVDIWSCVLGPERSTIRWHHKKIAFLKVKVPVVHTWRNIWKKKVVAQRFRGRLLGNLIITHKRTLALETKDPDVILQLNRLFLTDANMKSVKDDLSQKVYDTLRDEISLNKLKEALPKEFQKLNMTIVRASFRNLGGHAIADIDLQATVSEGSKVQSLQQVAASFMN